MDPLAWMKTLRQREDDIGELTTQFSVTLRAYFARVSAVPPHAAKVHERVRELLDPSRTPTWNDCYEVEQLLVDLFDGETLRAELETRKLEASNLRPMLTAQYLKAIEATDNTAARQRALLARLVNDLQWRYTINQGKRRFAKSLTSRTGIVSLVILVVYAGLVAAVRWSRWDLKYDDMSLFFVAAITGAWGATFSMMTSIKGRIDASEIYDLNVMRAFVMIASRVLIGVAAASVLFFFLSSGLLAGTAFPTLSSVAAAQETAAAGNIACIRPGPNCLAIKDFALLVVWSFLAGFSEQLVPGLLAKTESRADGTPPDRFRPSGGEDSPGAPGPADGKPAPAKTTSKEAAADGTTSDPTA